MRHRRFGNDSPFGIANLQIRECSHSQAHPIFETSLSIGPIMSAEKKPPHWDRQNADEWATAAAVCPSVQDVNAAEEEKLNALQEMIRQSGAGDLIKAGGTGGRNAHDTSTLVPFLTFSGERYVRQIYTAMTSRIVN